MGGRSGIRRRRTPRSPRPASCSPRLRPTAPRGHAAETITRCLALLSRLYGWAHDRGLIECPNPVSKVEKPLNHSADGFDYLHQPEVAKLLSWSATHQPTEFPLYATAVYTG